MENRLPAFGIKVAALPADKGGGKSVSPSYVRRLLAEGKRREVKNLLPEATYRYLLTPAGEGACRRLRQLYK
jgi:[citrate (pro-3S)-lyase] ligase